MQHVIFNLLIAACYIGLALLPVWRTTSAATLLLRMTLFWCGVGHSLHSAIIIGHEKLLPFLLPLAAYWDLTTALIGIATLGYILKTKRIITTIAHD